jgi:hypothetical protein
MRASGATKLTSSTAMTLPNRLWSWRASIMSAASRRRPLSDRKNGGGSQVGEALRVEVAGSRRGGELQERWP